MKLKTLISTMASVLLIGSQAAYADEENSFHISQQQEIFLECVLMKKCLKKTIAEEH